MKSVRHPVALFMLLAGGVICSVPHAYAQDIVLDVKITVGDSAPVSRQYTAVAGTEIALHGGSMFRIVAVPTVLSNGRVQLALRVFDATSSASAPLSSQMVIIVPGKEATIAHGNEPPDAKTLRIQIIPRLE